MRKLHRVTNKTSMFVKIMNNLRKETLTVILVVVTVLTSSNVIRNKAVHIFSQSIMTSLEASSAFAEQQKEHTGSATKHNHSHNDSSSETHKVQKQIKTYDVPDTFKKQLDQVFPAYFHIQFALSHDNSENASEGAKHLQMTLSNVDMSLVTGEAHMAWMKELAVIKKNSKQIAESKDIGSSRKAFLNVSHSLINVRNMFGTSGTTDMYRFHCPMAANNKGADWLQSKSEIENPYFGSSMLKCGGLVKTIN